MRHSASMSFPQVSVISFSNLPWSIAHEWIMDMMNMDEYDIFFALVSISYICLYFIKQAFI